MFNNKSVVFFLCLVYFVSISHCWDIAVTSGSDIGLLFANGSFAGKVNITNQTTGSLDLGAVTFDSVHHQLFVVNTVQNKQNHSKLETDSNNINKNNQDIYDMVHSILSIQLSPTPKENILRQLKTSITTQPEAESIQAIAYDPVSSLLFWTETLQRKIMTIDLSAPTQINVLFEFLQEIPSGIAVDSCEQLLFWTNIREQKATIERSTILGKNRTVIINEDMYVPTAIAVDQALRKIFWADDTEGIYFRIESANFDGTHRLILAQERHQQPYGIAVGINNVFWTDWTNSAVWSIDKNNIDDTPLMVYKFAEGTRISMAAKNSQIVNQTQCQALLQTISQYNESTTEIYITTKQEKSITIPPVNPITTQNVTPKYIPKTICQHNGTLAPSTGKCICTPEYVGDKCEISVCHNFCLHGSCQYNPETKHPECNCHNGYLGLRCETDLCHGFCLNGGKCSLYLNSYNDLNPQPHCSCSDEFVGNRCEQRQDVEELCRIYCEQGFHFQSICKCTSFDSTDSSRHINSLSNPEITQEGSFLARLHDPILLALLVSTIVLAPTCMALLTAVCWLKKRRTIKRRIIVNKNVTPLTCRPNPPPDQCEITIENCCNMNICETPCFEPPQLRTSKQAKTEEKKTLLTNMEGDDIY